MRVEMLAALVLLSACAGQRLALTPSSHVDFSGHWKLNEADSDDPLRLTMSQLDAATNTSPAGTQGNRGSRGGRSSTGAGAPGGGSGLAGPTMPGMSALRDGLQWPGKELDVKQVAGVVAITSAGISQVYQPAQDKRRPAHGRRDDGGPGNRDLPNREMPAREQGDGLPARCGWEKQTLVVDPRGLDGESPPFEKRYSVSSDGQRLIEVVSFRGGRSGGYTVSRVWDRVAS